MISSPSSFQLLNIFFFLKSWEEPGDEADYIDNAQEYIQAVFDSVFLFLQARLRDKHQALLRKKLFSLKQQVSLPAVFPHFEISFIRESHLRINFYVKIFSSLMITLPIYAQIFHFRQLFQ